MKKNDLIYGFSIMVLLLLVIPINTQAQQQDDYLIIQTINLVQTYTHFNNNFSELNSFIPSTNYVMPLLSFIIEKNDLIYFFAQDFYTNPVDLNLYVKNKTNNIIEKKIFISKRNNTNQLNPNGVIIKDDIAYMIIQSNGFIEPVISTPQRLGLIKINITNGEKEFIDYNKTGGSVGFIFEKDNNSFFITQGNMIYEINYSDLSIINQNNFSTSTSLNIRNIIIDYEKNVFYTIITGINDIFINNLTDLSYIKSIMPQFSTTNQVVGLLYNDLLFSIGQTGRINLFNVSDLNNIQQILINGTNNYVYKNILPRQMFNFNNEIYVLSLGELYKLNNETYTGETILFLDGIYIFQTKYKPKLLNQLNIPEDLLLNKSHFYFEYDLNYFYENINNVKIIFSDNEITKQNNFSNSLIDINITQDNKVIFNYKGNTNNVFFHTIMLYDENGYNELFTLNTFYSMTGETIIEEGFPKWIITLFTTLFVVLALYLMINFTIGTDKLKGIKK